MTDQELQSLRNMGNLCEEAADEIERWRMLAIGVARDLSQARIWGGMEWHYNPLDPMYYKPALDRIRKALDEIGSKNK